MAVTINANLKSEKTDKTLVLTTTEDSYKAGLEEAGIEFKVAKEVETFGKDYLNAAATVAAEEAEKAFDKDKSIERVEVTLPYGTSKVGANEVKYVVVKQNEGKNPQTGDKTMNTSIRAFVKSYNLKPGSSHVKTLKEKMTAKYCK